MFSVSRSIFESRRDHHWSRSPTDVTLPVLIPAVPSPVPQSNTHHRTIMVEERQEVEVPVKRVFGSRALDDVEAAFRCSVRLAPSDSIRDVKEKICDALRSSTEFPVSNIGPDELMIQFGPIDRKLGRQYVGDPTVDESKVFLHMYSILGWVERFPGWGLSVSFLPPTPPAPGVAIHKAAAMAENKDPDKAVADARRNGEIPRINQLAAPWGPKPYMAPSAEQLVEMGYAPVTYPAGFSPSLDRNASASTTT